jgi:hypothetical protein
MAKYGDIGGQTYRIGAGEHYSAIRIKIYAVIVELRCCKLQEFGVVLGAAS